jgi:hypothetical protein
MNRRQVFGFLAAAAAGVRAFSAESPSIVRGRLSTGSPARLSTDSGVLDLDGDAPSLLVLADSRLDGVKFEASGTMGGAGKFRVDPIHKRNMFVLERGKRLMISYWCEVCSIRTWQPGTCLCCQDETQLDLGESFETVK